VSSTTNAAALDAELEEFVGQFYDDPLGYVMCAFPWGQENTPLVRYKEPRIWQCEVLEWLGGEIKDRAFDGITPVAPIRGAVSSGHGAGKGALTGMLTNFIMSTRRDAKGTVTANTSTQLDDKTWAAILWWMKLSLTNSWFEGNTQILYRKGHRESWRVTPQTCAPENSEAFAGQHSERSTSFYMNDEDSNVPDVIHEVQEGGLAKGEPMYFLWGNPTRRSGAFYDAVFGGKRHRWKSWIIDTRTVEGHNAELIAEYLEDYGEDSDFFRVRVQGLPPNASDAQFIDAQRVLDAQKRQVVVLPDEPLVAGCDLAWGGSDFNVIRFRRGRDARSIPAIRIPGKLTADPAIMANRLADVLTTDYYGQRVAMLFMDSSGISGPIAARLREIGYRNVAEVNFGAHSPDEKHTRFYRDYMWKAMKDWLATAAIDNSPRLSEDLQMPGVRDDKQQRVWLESKEDIRKRTKGSQADDRGKSPDDADALALTFAQTVKMIRPPSFTTPGPTFVGGGLSWAS
jgi:hypothetical protein